MSGATRCVGVQDVGGAFGAVNVGRGDESHTSLLVGVQPACSQWSASCQLCPVPLSSLVPAKWIPRASHSGCCALAPAAGRAGGMATAAGGARGLL